MLTSQIPSVRKTSQKRGRSIPSKTPLTPLQAKRQKKSAFFERNHKLPFTVAISTKGLTKGEEQTANELVGALATLDNTYVLNTPLDKESDWQKFLTVADVVVIFPAQQRSSIQSFLTPLKAGVIPIVCLTEGTKSILVPFDPVEEKGNCFFYTKPDVWNIFAAIIKAQENYKFPYDWENLIKACMESAS
jgi:hypothetical protein